MNPQRIVLVIPNTRWFGKRPWIVLPYAALILTEILRKDFDFRIIDANGGDLSEDRCREQIRELNPRIVLVTGSSVEYHSQTHRVCLLAKEALPDVITVMGGVYPTTLPEEAGRDDHVDWLFMHHAEERLIPFLHHLLSGQIETAQRYPGTAHLNGDGRLTINPPEGYIANVKIMAKPDYSLVDLAPYLTQNTLDYQFNSDSPTAFIITSYGCPYNCIFCASRTISGRGVVFRPVEDVLEEIDYLVDTHHIGCLIFVDDALLANRKRIVRLLESLIEKPYELTWKAATVSAWHLDRELLELMKASGCTQLTISVESGSQRVLREVIRKPLKLEIIPDVVRMCREVGIDLGANFVIGTPGETWEDIRESFRFADACDFDLAHFHIATPLPATDLYRQARANGYLPDDFSFLNPKFFGFGQGFITTDEFTPFELTVLRSFEWDRINFSTPEKRRRVARLYGTTEEKLTEHRRQTRRKLGIHF